MQCQYTLRTLLGGNCLRRCQYRKSQGGARAAGNAATSNAATSNAVSVTVGEATPPTAPGTPSVTVSPREGAAGLDCVDGCVRGRLLPRAPLDLERVHANQQNEIAQTTQESYVDTGDGSTNGLPVGSYYYKIVAVDQLGNISTASGEGSGTVAADSSLPRASFAAPTPVSSSTVNGTVALTTSADAPTTTTTISYGFDPIGFRRSRTVNGTTTRFLLGGLIEATTTGSITGFDVDGPIGDLAHYSSAPSSSVNPNYSYYSGQGDLATEASHNGNRTRVGSPDMQELYTGRWDKKHDFVSGLIEMGVRPYEPGIGRFLSVDPIEGGSCGSYDYVCQDPINLHNLDGKATPIWSLLCKIVCRPRLTRVAVPPAVLQAAKERGFN
jgi:RHS repeat-associated protein